MKGHGAHEPAQQDAALLDAQQSREEAIPLRDTRAGPVVPEWGAERQYDVGTDLICTHK
jgi:hypothetical protein